MRRFRSTASRIVFLHIIAIALTAVFMPLVLFWLLNRETGRLHQRAAEEQANTIARVLSISPGGQMALDLTPALKAQFSEAYGRYFYAVLEPDGKVLFSSGGNVAPVFPLDSAASSSEIREVEHGDKVISGASVPENIGGHPVVIQVGEDLSHRDVLTDDIVANFFKRVGWITFPILLLLLTADIIIFRRAVRPLIQASQDARNIGPMRTDVRIPTANIPSEIRPLVEAVNQALDRLERGFRVQREFTADAAHELRTPLAILRARLETITDTKLRQKLHDDIDSMSRIINQLLEVAELDAVVVTQSEQTDLASVGSEVVQAMAPLALRQNRSVALMAAAEPVWVRGNAEMIRRAIRNLVENALHHTPPGTTVEVNVGRDGSVLVSDEGPGVPPAERELIFQRFWRKDRRRSGGAGLGLAIVRRIVDAHNGSIAVTNGDPRGAVFSMRLNLTRDRL
ncbi:sensor histidine kinase [Bradyrhizobium canariense]|uniref:histidine kinase n=1 Tax=Bradyrhizobium canariense TaxID=255045 RepID=A0A1H1UE13_9BRAD|nr:ATP-binding protein [Bradyrhizobium canariense]SDS70754.1 signal transduction histidine kinase [Bradyrhizobium canariense]